MELTILQQHGICPLGVSSNLTRKRRTSSIQLLTHERKSIKMISYPTSSSSSVAKAASGVPSPPQLDLTEENVQQVLADARVEFSQLFDLEVGMTGEAELAELDGPFVRISLRGRFWHKRSTVLARLANYLKQRIPEILEVDIEDEKQLDDSPENF